MDSTVAVGVIVIKVDAIEPCSEDRLIFCTTICPSDSSSVEKWCLELQNGRILGKVKNSQETSVDQAISDKVRWTASIRYAGCINSLVESYWTNSFDCGYGVGHLLSPAHFSLF